MEILVLIDCQNDFIDGSLRNEEAIKKIPNIVKKIDNFEGDVIYVTQDTHDPDYLNTPEGNKLPVVHCVNRSNGWMINSDVQNALNEAYLRGINVIYIEKPTFGSFDLIDYLEEDINEYDKDERFNIEFVGFCTDICVVSNVLMAKAALFDSTKIQVDASCCAGVTPESHKAALLTMKMCQVDIVNE